MAEANNFLKAQYANDEIYNFLKEMLNILNRSFDGVSYKFTKEDMTSIRNLSLEAVEDCNYLFDTVVKAIAQYEERGLISEVNFDALTTPVKLVDIEYNYDNAIKLLNQATTKTVIADKVFKKYCKNEISEESVKDLIDNTLIYLRKQINTVRKIVEISNE